MSPPLASSDFFLWVSQDLPSFFYSCQKNWCVFHTLMHLASQEGYVYLCFKKWLAGWQKKKKTLTKQTNKQINHSIKLEFLKYPSNTTSFIARLVSNLSPQQIPVHRHKLTHAAWPLHWLSLKIKKLLSPQTWLSLLHSFREEGEKEGGP